MKTLLSLFTLCLLALSGQCQRHKVELSHYIFSEFIKGTVLMKSGTKNFTMLNYNALTEEMVFDKNGNKLAMAQLEEIDTVYIDDRKFIPLQGKFVEILYQNKYDLYACHKCSVIDPGKPAAYGGTSQTSSTTTFSSFISNGQAYQLKLPDGFTTKTFNEYFLKKDGKLTMFVSLRQLSKLFGEKSEQFKNYVKENKVDFEDPDAMAELVKYMEGQ
ncbi:MAG: hypothetical protein M0Q53_20270 [Prolixibacteraceae bacterium]|jgi:hypothetical protein|nr:hypothetical protein [Prolixibacteraceae bacterium]